MGGDHRPAGDFHVQEVSIHAPAWGATKVRRRRPWRMRCFNPRPRVGGDDLVDGVDVDVLPVSIHAPAWGATGLALVAALVSKFQSTPPRGGRRGIAAGGEQAEEVSIHAPAWGATAGANASSIDSLKFQSTPPRGGRPGFAVILPAPGGFNPRPRVGGDCEEGNEEEGCEVSIHAPAWGATWQVERADQVCGVSIHAPAWGATPVSIHTSRALQFQSTPPRGGRPHTCNRAPRRRRVSIHAPAWGATKLGHPRMTAGGGFNPRPRVGGDVSVTVATTLPFSFNPRPRVGGDIETAR